MFFCFSSFFDALLERELTSLRALFMRLYKVALSFCTALSRSGVTLFCVRHTVANIMCAEQADRLRAGKSRTSRATKCRSGSTPPPTPRTRTRAPTHSHGVSVHRGVHPREDSELKRRFCSAWNANAPHTQSKSAKTAERERERKRFSPPRASLEHQRGDSPKH